MFPLVALMLLAADSPFQEQTVKFTGGPYKDEVFKYQLLAPAKIESGKKYPLVLFLHGAGERGTDNQAQLKYFPELMAKAEYREKYPCFVVAPQCRPDKKWSEVDWGSKKSSPMAEKPGEQMEVAIAVLKKTLAEHPIDEKRVYLTGLSMGGYGSWELALRHPEWFAAVAPICGGGDETHAKKLVALPVWAWHGDKDGAVPVERSRQMIEAIKAAGGDPKYTEIAGGGHNVWDQAYQDAKGITPWLFEQQRK